MNKKITIAIDGFSSTGKSTIAKLIANKYNYIYVDTGAMYRAVTLFAKNNGFVEQDSLDRESLIANLPNISLRFQFNENLGFAEMFLNNENVEKEIRTLEISQLVSKIAAISEVRKKLVAEQQEMGKNGGIVMDGRDIGSVVFPNAELKLFLNASAEVRARRRHSEYIKQNINVDYSEVLNNLQSRDLDDSNRQDSPLIVANDAIEIDNSSMTIDEQLILVKNILKDKFNL